MEGSLYNRLKKYLQHQYISPNLSPTERKKLIQQSKTIEIKDGILYKKENRHSKKLVRIARESEVEPILFLTHIHPLGGHFNSQKWSKRFEKHTPDCGNSKILRTILKIVISARDEARINRKGHYI